MKTKFFFGIIALFLGAIDFVSCNDDDSDKIGQHDRLLLLNRITINQLNK